MMRSLLTAFATLVMSACANDTADQLVGTLERDRLELIAEANEPIVAVAVKEGDTVAAGSTLLKLNSATAQARLDQAMAAVAVAERRLEELVKGPRSQEIQQARAALESAISLERTATNEYERVDDLVERRLFSQSQLDAARAQRDSAISMHKQASARLNLLLEGTRREAIEQAEAELKGATAALGELKTSLARHTVVAPRAGRIEALPFKLGERPPVGAPIVVMLADGAPYARIYIPETRRALFAAGARVHVRVDGSERDYAGVARFISSNAQFTPYYALTQDDRSRLSFLAEIDLPESEATSLPTGIPVQVTMDQP
jgi:HlyD family secretion protein